MKENNDREKQETKEGLDKLTMMVGMFGNFMKETYKDKKKKEEKDKEEKENKEQKEAEKEEKEKAEKKEKEETDKVEKEATRSWMIAITKDRNTLVDSLAAVQNQLAPQKTITGGTSVATISTLTSTSSPHKQITASPRSFI